VLTATGLVNVEGEILTPYRIETPKPIDIKFVTGAYVREMTFCAKFGANPSKYVKYNTFDLFIYLFNYINVKTVVYTHVNGE